MAPGSSNSDNNFGFTPYWYNAGASYIPQSAIFYTTNVSLPQTSNWDIYQPSGDLNADEKIMGLLRDAGDKMHEGYFSAASQLWGLIHSLLDDVRSRTQSAGTQLQGGWNPDKNDAARAFFDKVGGSAYSLDDWVQAAAASSKALDQMATAVANAKKTIAEAVNDYNTTYLQKKHDYEHALDNVGKDILLGIAGFVVADVAGAVLGPEAYKQYKKMQAEDALKDAINKAKGGLQDMAKVILDNYGKVNQGIQYQGPTNMVPPPFGDELTKAFQNMQNQLGGGPNVSGLQNQLAAQQAALQAQLAAQQQAALQAQQQAALQAQQAALAEEMAKQQQIQAQLAAQLQNLQAQQQAALQQQLANQLAQQQASLVAQQAAQEQLVQQLAAQQAALMAQQAALNGQFGVIPSLVSPSSIAALAASQTGFNLNNLNAAGPNGLSGAPGLGAGGLRMPGMPNLGANRAALNGRKNNLTSSLTDAEAEEEAALRRMGGSGADVGQMGGANPALRGRMGGPPGMPGGSGGFGQRNKETGGSGSRRFPGGARPMAEDYLLDAQGSGLNEMNSRLAGMGPAGDVEVAPPPPGLAGRSGAAASGRIPPGMPQKPRSLKPDDLSGRRRREIAEVAEDELLAAPLLFIPDLTGRRGGTPLEMESVAGAEVGAQEQMLGSRGPGAAGRPGISQPLTGRRKEKEGEGEDRHEDQRPLVASDDDLWRLERPDTIAAPVPQKLDERRGQVLGQG